MRIAEEAEWHLDAIAGGGQMPLQESSTEVTTKVMSTKQSETTY